PLFSLLSTLLLSDFKKNYENQTILSTNAVSLGGNPLSLKGNRGALILTNNALVFISASIFGRKEFARIWLTGITSINIHRHFYSELPMLVVQGMYDPVWGLDTRLMSVVLSSVGKAQKLDDLI